MHVYRDEHGFLAVVGMHPNSRRMPDLLRPKTSFVDRFLDQAVQCLHTSLKGPFLVMLNQDCELRGHCADLLHFAEHGAASKREKETENEAIEHDSFESIYIAVIS